MNAADLRGLAVAGKLAQNAESHKGDLTTLSGDYLMEPKFDGWRIIAFVGGGYVDLFARSGNTPPGDLPKVKAELLAHFPPGTILDGEAVALNVQPDGTVENLWGVAQSVMTTLGPSAVDDQVTYMVFDLIAHRGIDARALPMADRRVLLEQIFEYENSFETIALSTITEATDENYEALLKMGFEGAVVKRLDKPYGSDKREGGGWGKLKLTTRVEGVIMGAKPGKNGFTGLVGSIIFGQYDPDTGELVERGAASGMDMRTRIAMTKLPGAINVEVSDEWLGRVIEVAHNGVDIGGNGSGRFRHPRFKRLRDDKTAEQVVLHDA